MGEQTTDNQVVESTEPKYPSAAEIAAAKVSDAHEKVHFAIAFACQDNLELMSKLIDLTEEYVQAKIEHDRWTYGR